MKKYYASVALTLLCVAPLATWGQVLTDPTRPPLGINDAISGSLQPAQVQVRGLQSVIVSPTRCAAIIDGKTVALGAKHGSELLIEVNAHGVVLQGGSGRRALTLFPAVGMKIIETSTQDKPAVKCRLDKSSQKENSAKQTEQKEKK